MSGSKRELAFLIASSGQSYAAGNVALGINKYMPPNADYDIFVYYNTFTAADIAAFEKIPHVIMHPFSLPPDFVEKIMFKADKENSRIKTPASLMAFSHFEVFSLLEKYKKVIWLDTDMSIQGDISELINFSGFTVTDDGEWTVRSQFLDTAKITGYDLDRPSICTGLIVADDSLPYKKLHEWCYSKALEYAECLNMRDQAIINLALQEFKITPNIISRNIWQCTTFRPLVHIAKIAHFGTADAKPWKNSIVIRHFPEWYRTHLEWLKLGGDDFPGHDDIDILNRLKPEHLKGINSLPALEEKLDQLVTEINRLHEEERAIHSRIDEIRKDLHERINQLNEEISKKTSLRYFAGNIKRFIQKKLLK